VYTPLAVPIESRVAGALRLLGGTLMIVALAGPVHAGPCDLEPGETPAWADARIRSLGDLPVEAQSLDALWMETRAADYEQLASRLQETDPALVRTLLERADCMRRAARERTEARSLPSPQHSASPWPELPGVATEQRRALDDALAGIRSSLADARFREALEQASAFQSRVGEDETTIEVPAVRDRAAQAAILAATGHAALGESAEAEQELRRARQLVPDLALPADAPPKVQRLWSRLADVGAGGGI